jgi:hypothetical protein
MKPTGLLLLVLLLTACGESRQLQKQAASDAIAGTEALESSATPKQAVPVIAEGVKTNVETAVGEKRKDLPPPKMPAATIAGQSQAYLNNAQATQKAFYESNSFWAWAGGGLLAVLGILRFIPGAHQPIVSLVQTLLENRIDRAARQRKEGLVDAAKVAMDVIETLPDEVGRSVKDRVFKKLPSKAGDAVKSYLAEQE